MRGLVEEDDNTNTDYYSLVICSTSIRSTPLLPLGWERHHAIFLNEGENMYIHSIQTYSSMPTEQHPLPFINRHLHHHHDNNKCYGKQTLLHYYAEA